MRRGRKEEALQSIKRLGRKSSENAQEALAMMERTVEIEAQMGGAPTLLDLFKGTDLRRTTVKVSPGTYLTDVLDKACAHFKLSSTKYTLKYVCNIAIFVST